MELESLLGGLVADLTRRCDIMFPEGDTTTLGFDCEETWRDPSFELAESVGDDAFASVGVGGVTSVVGASTRFGGVAGIWVMIRLGANDRNDVVDFVSYSVCICGGDACEASFGILASRFFPPKSAPNLPSTSSRVFGAVALRTGANASFSLPTGDGDVPCVFRGVSLVCRRDASSAELVESTCVSCVGEWMESIVSEAIRGEDSVMSPAWEWCGDMPGLFGGALVVC
jgi:hypothetical protein